MLRLVRYLKDYKIESVLAPLFKFLEAAFELLVPLVIAKIIDIGIGNKNSNYIIKMGILQALVLWVISSKMYYKFGILKLEYNKVL